MNGIARAGEGPIGMIVCPSRELARQTHEVIEGYIKSLKEDGWPELRSLLVMGGIDMRTQVCRCSFYTIRQQSCGEKALATCMQKFHAHCSLQEYRRKYRLIPA